MTFDLNKDDVIATTLYDLRQRGFAVTSHERRMGIKPAITGEEFERSLGTAIIRHAEMAREEWMIDQMYLL